MGPEQEIGDQLLLFAVAHHRADRPLGVRTGVVACRVSLHALVPAFIGRSSG
jgi:hypothetical protein